jgi:putative phosphoribosyl transferase
MRSGVLFADRDDAGRRLSEQLEHLKGADVVVVGLPRGGVPVAAAVARRLSAPLDVIVVRKLGLPYQPELAMGAIGEGHVRVMNLDVVHQSGVSDDEIMRVERRERAELERRAERFRAGRDPVPLRGKVVVVVDDGVATGSTAKAACLVARDHGAARVVLAAPVAPRSWTERLEAAADEYVTVATPEPFHAVGQFYERFDQTTDDEVVACLRAAAGHKGNPRVGPRDEDVRLVVGEGRSADHVDGHLVVPAGATGVVVFAHGSGSSRHSARNRYVASVLNEAGLATLLFDLLTKHEERRRENVFDIPLLAHRLELATAWVRSQPDLATLPVGWFGASTGAAAALWAASETRCDVGAIVSRGGRPDLAGGRLGFVRAPTLLIVGGDDAAVLTLNREAKARLRCRCELAVVPGATHLFEEPGTLEAAATQARHWFTEHLGA